MLKWADNVVEESTATTTGAYQLGGVPVSGERPGAQIFVAGIGAANTCDYYAYQVNGSAYEFGTGTVTDGAPDTLSRDAIDRSSNGGAAVDWTGLTVRVACVLASRRVINPSNLIAASAESFGVSPSNTGVANALAFQAALDKRGHVSLTTPGIYPWAAPTTALVGDVRDYAANQIHSDTRLYIGPGVRIVMPHGTASIGRTWLCNRYCGDNKLGNITGIVTTNGTAQDARNRYHAITLSAAHGRAVGDYVLIKGDTSGVAWNRVWRVDSVQSTTQLTVRGRNLGTTTAIAGTPFMYAADSEISIVIDGVIDGQNNVEGNTNITSWAPNRHGILLHKFGNAYLEGNFVRWSGACWASNFDHLEVGRAHMEAGAIGISVNGPFNSAVLKNVTAREMEEAVLVVNSISYYGPPQGLNDLDGTLSSNGDIGRAEVRGLDCYAMRYRAVVVEMGDGYTTSEVLVNGMSVTGGDASNGAPPVYVIVNSGQTGRLDRLALHNIYYEPPNAVSFLAIDPTLTGVLNVGTIDIKGLNIPRGVVNNGVSNSALIIPAGGMTLDKLSIADSRIVYDLDASTTTQSAILLNVACTIKDIFMRGVQWVGSGTTRKFIALNVSAELLAAPIVNAIECSVAGNSQVHLVRSTESGTRVNLKANVIRSTHANSAFLEATENCTIVATDNDGEADTVTICRLGEGVSGKTFDLTFGGNRTGNHYLATGYANGNAHVFNVRSEGANLSTAPDSIHPRTGNTVNFLGNCADMKANLDPAVSSVARTDGSIVYNTNAALGTLGAAGLVVGQGVAANSWHLMANPVLVY